MTIRAHYDGQRIVLDEPMPPGIPANTPVQVILPGTPVAPPSQRPLPDRLRDLATDFDHLPTDFAAQHDHYVKGLPKR